MRSFIIVASLTTAMSGQADDRETVHETEVAPRSAALLRAGFGVGLAEAGLAFERVIGPHLTFVAAGDGTFSRNRVFTSAGATGDVGLRWYFFDRPLSGPWVGLSVPVGYSVANARGPLAFGGDAGLTGLAGLGGLGGVPMGDTTTGTLSIGGKVLLGWTFRFGNGLTLQAAAGPCGALSRSVTTLIPPTELGPPVALQPVVSGNLGLSAVGALGASF